MWAGAPPNTFRVVTGYTYRAYDLLPHSYITAPIAGIPQGWPTSIYEHRKEWVETHWSYAPISPLVKALHGVK